MSRRRLIDLDDDNLPAINWDGTKPIVGNGYAIVKSLYWYNYPGGDEQEEWRDYRYCNGNYALVDRRSLRRLKRKQGRMERKS